MPALLLDTHVLVWFINQNPSLGRHARSIILRAHDAGELCLSAVTFWEIALLFSKERIALTAPPMAWRMAILRMGVTEFPLDGDIAVRPALLADAPRDPADRFIMATARQRGATLVTADENILDWPGPLPRLDART